MHMHNASDLHLVSASTPFIRILGDLRTIGAEKLSTDDMLDILRQTASPAQAEQFMASGDLDYAYEVPNMARYRINFYRENNGIAAAFREIPTAIKTLEELGMPRQLQELAMLPKGVVLVTGPTGSGKSTTLAALLNYANTVRRDHIITIEDPIEFLHSSRSCLINQREVGRDTRSFAAALRSALREDPDIILVGEMRDLETISLALEAAETGHLVFATLHTISASKTIDRIIEVFPAGEQQQIRTSLAESIQAVISQTLFKRRDGTGRIPALEILLATPAIRNLIRENKTFQIQSILQTNHSLGMRTLDDDIERLLAASLIEPAAALVHAQNKQRISEAIKKHHGV